MNFVKSLLLLGALVGAAYGCNLDGQAEGQRPDKMSGDDTQSAVRVLRTSTPCIATQTFLDELKELILASEERKDDENAKRGGAVYTRWGRKECPSGSQLVYTGVAGGPYYTHKGGPSNTLCLTMEPEYGNHTTGSNHAYMYGTEYHYIHRLPGYEHLANHDVPCAACKTPGKITTLMIPARKSCPKGWRQEYSGYLMGGHHGHVSSEVICVDVAAEQMNFGHERKNGNLLYIMEGQCGSLPCPPFKNNWELTCVVCTQ